MRVHSRRARDSADSIENCRGFSIIELIMVILAILILIALFLPPVTRSREAARRSQCRNNLKQIGLALHNYHDVYGTFPPAYTVDADGEPLHSWRTLLLPYIDQKPLYDRIDLSKPWDDPVNEEVFKTRVQGYACPSNSIPLEKTTYLAVVTTQSALRVESSCAIRDIKDGTSNTLLVIEVDQDHAVPWMAPQDADVTIVTAFLEGKSKHTHTGGGHALLADGTVRFLSQNIDRRILIGLTTADGGEEIGDF